MSGAGSGGGGGSSGTVDYPDYMKDRHSKLYDNMMKAVTVAQNNNPYKYLQAWSPSSMITNMTATIDCYDDIIRGFDPLSLWTELIGQIPPTVIGLIDNGPIDEYIESQKERLCTGLEREVIPKYRRGMQDIGAVMTSAFKIGEALLWMGVVDEQVALEKEFKGKLALAAYEYSFKSTNDIIQLTLQKISYHKEIAHYNLEMLRMGYTAMKEYTDSKNIYDIERAKWNLEMYKYLMDSLGSISASAGTSYTTSASGTSRVASGIGGALTGAAAGAMAGGAIPGVGNVAGGIIGGAMGLVGGLF